MWQEDTEVFRYIKKGLTHIYNIWSFIQNSGSGSGWPEKILTSLCI